MSIRIWLYIALYLLAGAAYWHAFVQTWAQGRKDLKDPGEFKVFAGGIILAWPLFLLDEVFWVVQWVYYFIYNLSVDIWCRLFHHHEESGVK